VTPRLFQTGSAASSFGPQVVTDTRNVSYHLEVYAHLFERADHSETARAALEANYTAISDATAKWTEARCGAKLFDDHSLVTG
jgi:hypothetical protein